MASRLPYPASIILIINDINSRFKAMFRQGDSLQVTKSERKISGISIGSDFRNFEIWNFAAVILKMAKMAVIKRIEFEFPFRTMIIGA